MQTLRRQFGSRQVGLSVLAVLVFFFALPRNAAAECPFCDAVRPTWCQLREPADLVVLAIVKQNLKDNLKDELVAIDEAIYSLAVQDVARGDAVPQQLQLALSFDASEGDHVLLLGENETAGNGQETIRWNDLPMSLAAYKYLQAAPDLRKTPTERLVYFATFLEHEDSAIAEDAYMEFAHAPYSDVAAVGTAFDGSQLRRWLTDANVPDLRKGFYALALALAGGSEEQKQSNIEFLRAWVENPGDDFRRGLDGVMGALLLVETEDALEFIRERFLANPQAANGHVRNALSAIRFYDEFGTDPDRDKIAAAVACLLDRPAFATEAVIDLARWEAWETLPRVVALFEKQGYDNTTRHAVVAYLLNCDEPRALDELERLRELDAEFVDAAEERLLRFGGIR